MERRDRRKAAPNKARPWKSLERLNRKTRPHKSNDANRAHFLSEVRLPSTTARGIDRGHVDLAHGHHRLEGALCLAAPHGHCFREGARGDLPGKAPAVLTPTAFTFLPAVVD